MEKNNETPTGDHGQNEHEGNSGNLSKNLWSRIGRFWVKWWGTIVAIGVVVGILASVIAINQQVKDSRKEAEEKKQSQRKFRILVPLYASNQEYLKFISGASYAKTDISRKVSLDTVNAIEAGKKSWFRTNRGALDPTFTPDRVDFYFFPEGTDKKSFSSAFEHAMETAKADNVEVVGVIGHVTSTVTELYGETIYGRQDVQLPIILPLATATSLTQNLLANNVPAVLRLPPSNEKQAKIISDLLLDEGATRATIVKDLSNPTYSDDLIDSFRDNFVREPFRKNCPGNMYAVKHGRILAIIPTGGSNGESFLHTTVENLRSDALLFFGMTEGALETIAQARAASYRAKYTILSDGTIDEYLLPRANGIVYDQQPSKPAQKPNLRTRGKGAALKQRAPFQGDSTVPQSGVIYLTFPLEEAMPKLLKKALAELPDADAETRSLEMTHAIYAIDAVQILLSIIHDKIVKPRLPQEIKPGKKVVTDEFIRWRTEGQISDVSFSYDKDRKYDIDSFGNSTNMKYHLFRAQLPGVAAYDESFDPENVRWTHDTDYCSMEKRRQAH